MVHLHSLLNMNALMLRLYTQFSILNTCYWYFRAGKKLTISYPCVMLNVDVARNNTNDQYQVRIVVLQVILQTVRFIQVLYSAYWQLECY